MSAISDLGNASGFIYITDTNGTSVLSTLINSQDNVRRMLEDAGFSNPVAATGSYSPIFGRRYFLNSAGGAVEGVIAGALEITDYVVMKGLQSVFPKDNYTIAAGVLTPTRKSSITMVNVEGEGGASDTLDTITATGYLDGDIIIFKGLVTAHVITFSNGTGNIKLANAANFLTGDLTKGIVLQWNVGDTTWYEITRSPNPALSVATLRAAGIPQPVSGVDETTLTNGGGTINLEPGVDKGYQVYLGNPALAGSWVIQIQPAPATPYLDGDTMFVDYRTTATVGGNTVTIFGIALTTEQALEGRVVVKATYKLSDTTWYYDIFYRAYGVDIENKAHTAATYEPLLGNPAGNGYILSSTVGGVRSWIPNPSTTGNLWETGAGAASLQTKGNGANAAGDNSIAVGVNSTVTDLDGIAIGNKSTSNSSGIAIGGKGGGLSGANANGPTSIAIGSNSGAGPPTASGSDSIAIGTFALAQASESIAIGSTPIASGNNTIALGNSASALIDDTINISGTQITRKVVITIAGNELLLGSGAVVTIATDEIDLTAIADYTITIPTGALFYPDEVDLILTTLGGTITAQPFIRAGKTGSLAFYLAIVQTTALTATLGNRERKATLLSNAGSSTLTASITTGATGSSTIKGRFVFRGLLVEAQ